MYTENGLLVDLAEVEKVVDQCDVFTIMFRLFPERLLVDGRTSPRDGPLVALVEPVATVEERYHWLGRERPGFGPPERFTFFLWPHSIAFLEQCGIAARIRGRCETNDWPQAAATFDRVLGQLQEKELRATQAAITGEDCRTIWPTQDRSPRED